MPLQSLSRHMTNVYCFYSADIIFLKLSQLQYSTSFSSLRDHKLQYSVDSKNSRNSLTQPNSEQLMLQPLGSNPNSQVMNPGCLMRRGRTLQDFFRMNSPNISIGFQSLLALN